MEYILHNYRRCPFCIRVRIVFVTKDIPFEVVEEPLRKWTDWMHTWSTETGERARIPVLRVRDGDTEKIYTESNEINLMLDASDGDPVYTPEEDTVAYKEMYAWFSWCDDVFKHQIDRYKYGENLVFDREKQVEHERVLREMLQKLEDRLANRKHLLGGERTLADIAVIPFVRQIMRTRNGEFDFADFPKTERWTKDLIETDWFTQKVMQKHPLAPVHTE